MAVLTCGCPSVLSFHARIARQRHMILRSIVRSHGRRAMNLAQMLSVLSALDLQEGRCDKTSFALSGIVRISV